MKINAKLGFLFSGCTPSGKLLSHFLMKGQKKAPELFFLHLFILSQWLNKF